MNKVVIAMDAFKGSLSAAEATAAVARALTDSIPGCTIDSIPLSDGGEGLTTVLVQSLGGHIHTINAVDPLMRPITVQFGAVSGCAIIEMATAAGLTLLTKKERNPMRTTTYGVGMIIRAALDLGYKQLLIGLGGSATTDAGLGALQTIGLRCFDSQGRLIKEPITGAMMNDISHLDTGALRRTLDGIDIKVVCDVQNPFCGPNGAAFVYSPQKGATPADVIVLDNGLRTLSHLYRRISPISVDSMKGAGAAGGFGGTLAALTGATMASGIDVVLDLLRFSERVEGADLVITGEGRIDQQTLMGKLVLGVVHRVRAMHIPVLALAGQIENRAAIMRTGLLDALEITPRGTDPDEQMRPEVAARNIYDTMTEWLKFDHLKDENKTLS